MNASSRSARQALKQLFATFPRAAHPACARHPREPVQAVCSACRQLLCRKCADYDAVRFRFVCDDCRRREHRALSHFSLFSVLKSPFFYVAVAIIVAGTAYVCGVGNPGISDLARRDEGKPWYRQRLGYAWLEQGARARQRAAILRYMTDDMEKAEKWSKLAAKAYGCAAARWTESPVYGDLCIAEASMQLRAGRVETARRILNDIDFSADEPDVATRANLLFWQGLVAVESGDRPMAVTRWNELAEHIVRQERVSMWRQFDRMVDKMVQGYEAGRQEPMAIMRTRKLAGTADSPAEITGRLIRYCREEGVTLRPDLWSAIVPEDEREAMEKRAKRQSAPEKLRVHHYSDKGP